MSDRFAERLNTLLADSFPEVSSALRSERGRYPPNEEPGAYVIYETVFLPWVVAALTRGAEHDIRRAFAFIEDLLHDSDPRVGDLVRIGVLDGLRQDSALWTKAKTYMGPLTAAGARVVGG